MSPALKKISITITAYIPIKEKKKIFSHSQSYIDVTLSSYIAYIISTS